MYLVLMLGGIFLVIMPFSDTRLSPMMSLARKMTFFKTGQLVSLFST